MSFHLLDQKVLLGAQLEMQLMSHTKSNDFVLNGELHVNL